MARNLYSAYRSAGTSSGQYKASLFDVESKSDKMAFADKRGDWEQEKLSRRVETIGAGLELASTIAGGIEDKQKFKGKLEAMGSARTSEGALKYGELQPDTRSFGQKLFGAEREYTFGEGKDARTFSKAGVGVQGGRLLGESMLDEAGMGFTPPGTSEETSSKEGGSTSEISEYIKKPAPETLDVAVDSDKNLLESVPEYRQGKGLTGIANEKLYAEDPSMKGKSAEERVKKYEEYFPTEKKIDFKSITDPFG
jgi:hypothetical protein